jgi:hypothetical protein
VQSGAARFAEVGDGDNGQVAAGRQAGEWRQQPADFGADVLDVLAEECRERVQHDQPHVRQRVEPARQRDEATAKVEFGRQSLEEPPLKLRIGSRVGALPGVGDDARQIGAEGDEARADGVADVVFGGQNQRGRWEWGRWNGEWGVRRWRSCRGILSPFPIPQSPLGRVGPGLSGGESGGDVEGEEAFADAGVAGEQGDFAIGDSSGPEPGAVGGRRGGREWSVRGAEPGRRRGRGGHERAPQCDVGVWAQGAGVF